MIIGVSGKKQSGKDTVGKIIQYLTDVGVNYKSEHVPSFDNWLINYKDTTSWQIVKFADPVKDIVCLLTGCTKAQLEDEEFKNTPLGEKWYIFRMYNFDQKQISIGFDKQDLIDNEKSYNRFDYNFENFKLTPRLLLQLVGTECGRNIIHPNIWVNALFSNYKLKTSSLLNFDYKYPNWIITDVRFPNEVKAIEDRGGFVIRCNRDKYHNQQLINNARRKPTKSSDYAKAYDIPHESETALDNHSFKYELDNNGSIEDLIEQVKEILIKEKLI